MRKPPPFTRLYRQRRADQRNRNATSWVLIGSDAWTVAKTWEKCWHRAFVALPDEIDPTSIEWETLRGSPEPLALVRCGSVDGGQLEAVAREILSAGIPRIYDLAADLSYVQARRAA